ncbi:hypothetical protein ASF84_05725 [Pseudomonas sp. Leaf127]|uniref:PDR/VanB family oxidoreductase n=1 Tax=Pseudomonas sp. Leaf127 TaxID=1736267 RepID=UPI0007029C86|nr:PDR/VanB family oxidoreductase [Pseudomonas sp. Leaf127]KQQ60199.1 hypothetical protein ASF84_05725 [Pseudomonas sp. Leaf127]
MQASMLYPVYVKSITHEAEQVLAFDLRPVSGIELPPFTAGAHIDVVIEGMPTRSYSLLNHPDDKNRYVIAVARDPASRGGSRYLHERLRCGATLQVGAPRNLFALDPAACATVLIAGGIGITPLWSMAQQLESQGKPWTLYYFARESRHAALLERIDAASRNNVELLYALTPEQTMATLRGIFAADASQRHYYCCGPAGMLKAYKEAAAEVDSTRVHFESFVPTHEMASEGGYEVHLARSGKTLAVDKGQSLLEAMLASGIEVMNSCREGICGACEVAVLEGEPDHRDSILSDDERQAGKSMFVCCSGSKSSRLVLDI